MKLPFLPRNIERIAADECFAFACHPGVECFTNCCRQLELALTPYDVLRLKKSLGLSSDVFLDRYVIVEKEKEDIFPRFYLTMVDDGRASCVFVSEKGCTHYQDRPGACRTYPMGRAAMRTEQSTMEEFFVLLQEEHCLGFKETQQQSPNSYSQEQELTIYNEFNDAVATVLQHDKIRTGMVPTAEQVEDFVLCLYNIDTFRRQIMEDGKLLKSPLTEQQKEALKDDDKLLLFAIDWLKDRLFE